MLTRNFYNIYTSLLLDSNTGTSTATPTDYDVPVRMRLQDGSYTVKPLGNYYDNNTGYLYNISSVSVFLEDLMKFIMAPFKRGLNYNDSKCGVILGDGTTPPTYEDYSLENKITAGLGVVSGSSAYIAGTYNSTTHKMKSGGKITINNTSQSNITISEVGILFWGCLVYRDVITPIILEPGDSVVIEAYKEGEVFNYTPYPA